LIKLEIVVYTIESALKAQEAGADRLELCADAGEGGTTPSYGAVEVLRQNISIDLYAMVRPRGGDFLYNNYEFHAMKRDIAQFQRLSVDGVVLGILTKEGRIDVKRCRELIERARPLKVTCHRAFDRASDPFEALEDCVEAGFDRILTSGQKSQAVEGIPLLAELANRAGKRIIIMPGAGVNETNAEAILTKTGVKELHFSAVAYRPSEMEYRSVTELAMGSDASREHMVRTVDPEKIKAVRVIANQTLSAE
jgi:copper homeostasis protein